MTIVFFLICKFLFVPLLINGQGLGIFEKADSLAMAGEYFAAAVEYERIVFESDDKSIQNKALIKKGFAYKNAGEYQSAKHTFQRTDPFSLDDTLQYIARYETALNAYLAGDFGEAEAELVQLEYYISDTAFTNQALFLKILVLNEQQKWDEAKSLFIEYLKINHIAVNADEVYYFVAKPKLRNPEKAQWLSTFIPGSGQIYGGAVWSGLGSFLIQAGSLAFGGYYIWKGYYFRAFLTGFATFQTFYFGGVNNAAYVTVKNNEKKIRKYNDSVKKIILEIERRQ